MSTFGRPPVASGEVRTLFGGRRPAGVLFQMSSALFTGIAVAWLFYGMRAVLEVGGACADGGPYVSAQPCPDGVWMMAVGMPVMMITVILATFVALAADTPAPVFPMWALVFTALGANFLEFGFDDPVSVSWIVCGVIFELMALPAWLVVGRSLVPGTQDGPGAYAVRVNWLSIYLALGAIGWGLGWWSYDAWS